MSARGVYRGIHSSLFDDVDYQHLSSDARLLLLTARQCKEAGPAVIFRYYPEVLCHQTGLSRSRLDKALAELEQGNWAYHDASVLWVRNGLRHDPNLRLSDRKHLAAVTRQLDGLQDSVLVARFCEYYQITRPLREVAHEMLSAPPSTNSEKDSEKEKEKGVSAAVPSGSGHVAKVITEALDRSARLGAAPRLRSPEFWQAEARAANGTVDLAAEILKAEAWLIANPGRAPHKDLPRFVHNWLSRAKERV